MFRYVLAYYNRLGIERKLHFMGITTALMAGTLAVGSILLYQYYDAKNELAKELRTMGNIVAHSLTPDILPQDTDAIEQTLRLLRHKSTVEHAYVVSKENVMLAEYATHKERHDHAELLNAPPADNILWQGSDIFCIVPIEHNGRLLASLIIESSLDEFYIRLLQEVFAVLVFIFFTVVITFRYKAILQDSLLLPIDELNDTVKEILKTKDLSRKVPIRNDDEIGNLAESFNLMLSELNTYQEELKHVASTDLLTGTANRMSFEKLLKSEINASQRYDRRLSLIFFDIDHFKKVNDTYGHDIGDRVLRFVADTSKNGIRQTDTVARWGGEEFAIVLPETDRQNALRIADKIRIALGNAQLPPVASIHASFGVVELSALDTLESLLKRADEAMYRAKEEGRNRVIAG